MLQVNAAKPEVRSLLSARNELAGYLSRKRVIQQTRKAQSSQVARTQKSSRSPRPSQTKGLASSGMVPSGIPLAVDMEDLSILPPTTENPRECRTCYASDGCMLYRKVSECASTQSRSKADNHAPGTDCGERRNRSGRPSGRNLRSQGRSSHRRRCRILYEVGEFGHARGTGYHPEQESDMDYDSPRAREVRKVSRRSLTALTCE